MQSTGKLFDFTASNNASDFDNLDVEGAALVNEILAIAKYITSANISYTEMHNGIHIEENFKKLIVIFTKIKSYSGAARKKHLEELKGLYPALKENFYQIIREFDVIGLKEEVANRTQYQEHVKDIFNLREEAEKILTDGQKEIAELIALAKGQLAQIGVKEYEQVFGDESRVFEKSARLWLAALLISLTALIVIGVWYLPQVPDGANGGRIAEAIFRKIVVITGLFYLVALFSRNYRASKHNALVNKHRQNALKTFQIFIKSVQDDDPQTKNAVLLKATETIFGNQASGFLPDAGDADMSPKIIEIFKNFPTSAGK